MQYWLMKSEPDQFGIADLERVKVEPWTGVRSFFARAHMRAMAVGDAVLFVRRGAGRSSLVMRADGGACR